MKIETKDINGNINCVGCEDCRNCINCTNCKGCTGCVNCSNCNGCYSCVDCTDCNLCERCNQCQSSNNLYACVLCVSESLLYYQDNTPEDMEVKSMINGRPTKICKLELKDLNVKEGIVQFYAGTYEMDSFRDIILKSAYSKTLSENKARIKHYKNHDQTIQPGVIQAIECDEKGLLVTSKLMPSTHGKDTLIEYEYKAITEHSQGYLPVAGKIEHKDGVRILKEVELWEVSSLNNWGANENTPMISLKNRNQNDLMDNVTALHNILHKSSISDERAIVLEKELSKIQIHLKSLKPNLFTSEPTTGNSFFAMIAGK